MTNIYIEPQQPKIIYIYEVLYIYICQDFVIFSSSINDKRLSRSYIYIEPLQPKIIYIYFLKPEITSQKKKLNWTDKREGKKWIWREGKRMKGGG